MRDRMDRRTVAAVRILAPVSAALAMLLAAPAAAMANVGIPAGYIVGGGALHVFVAGAFTAATSALAVFGLRRLARTNAALSASATAAPKEESNAV
jgi:hypothetical protein